MESEIFTYFDDTLASRSVASRSQASELNLKISLSSFEKFKGGPFCIKEKFFAICHEIENLKSLWSKDLTHEI